MFPVGRIGHVEPAWRGDCLVGIQHTRSKGLRAQDVNVHVTRDGHVVGAHYATARANKFHDPSGKFTNTPYARLTLDQLRTFRPNSGGPERIDAATEWMEWAAGAGFTLMLEWKPDPHTSDAVARLAWKRVADKAAETGCKVAVMSIQRFRTGAKADRWERDSIARLRTASEAGLPTVMLWRRGSTISPQWQQVASAVKSAKPWVHIPAGMSRVGGSAKVVPPKARRAPKRRPRLNRFQRRRLARLRRIVRNPHRRLSRFQRRVFRRLRKRSK